MNRCKLRFNQIFNDDDSRATAQYIFTRPNNPIDIELVQPVFQPAIISRVNSSFDSINWRG